MKALPYHETLRMALGRRGGTGPSFVRKLVAVLLVGAAVGVAVWQGHQLLRTALCVGLVAAAAAVIHGAARGRPKPGWSSTPRASPAARATTSPASRSGASPSA